MKCKQYIRVETFKLNIYWSTYTKQLWFMKQICAVNMLEQI